MEAVSYAYRDCQLYLSWLSAISIVTVSFIYRGFQLYLS